MNHRPQSLREVAERADEISTFGWELQDWLHTIRSLRSRPRIAQTIREEPPLLADRISDGKVADAWLAAYAELTAHRIGITAPSWVHSPQRISPHPWFSVNDKGSRLLALRDSPAPFKNRNLFTPKVDLPINLRAGRPPVSAEQRRRNNAERQRRFRERRKAELEALRAAATARPD